MEGASHPPGSLIQAWGSCAVALRQLFLAQRIPAWSRPHRPVPTGGQSSSPGAPPGSVPPAHAFPFQGQGGRVQSPPKGIQDGQRYG